MNFKNTLLNVVTGITGICAVAVTVHSFRNSHVVAVGVDTAPRPIDSAVVAPLLKSGYFLGPRNARLTIVEFADYQCPVCASYESVLDSMRTRHPTEFAIAFHNYPLAYHPLAMPLAIAAECANRQGKFQAFHDSVFAGHADLGVVPVLDFARRAGVPDMPRFRACMADSTAKRVVTDDISVGTGMKISGTPTVIAAGMMHNADMRLSDLEALLAKQR